jgi:FHA domain/Zinc-ribbon containing domain
VTAPRAAIELPRTRNWVIPAAKPGCPALYGELGSIVTTLREGVVISASLTPTPASAPDSCAAGSFPGPGTYFCIECGAQLALREDDELPRCPRCESTDFRLDSIFESMQEHPGVTAEFEIAAEAPPTSWLDELRATLPAGSRHLVGREEDGELLDFEVAAGWTRIGRSVAADIRLDDPSVSRRHALIVSEPGESLKVLDDRSLNGVFVNGELREWGKLADGDELAIGRYRLFVLQA